jgi:hypothetical protein
LPFISPEEITARKAKTRFVEEKGMAAEDIGVFLITPCPALATSVKSPIGTRASSFDGAIAISEIRPALLSAIRNVFAAKREGVLPGRMVERGGSGGETRYLEDISSVAADGMGNCIRLLEAIESGRVRGVDFAELTACPGGCVGGVLTMENPHAAKARLNRLSHCWKLTEPESLPLLDGNRFEFPLEYTPEVMELSSDIEDAMRLFTLIDQIATTLPGMDCASCGSPNCRGLAEDIARGLATLNSCAIIRRNKEMCE